MKQSTIFYTWHDLNILQHTATHCNTLQHTATHCNTLQHSATHCNTLQHTATHCNTLHHTASYCNTLQHTACSTLQQSAAVLQCVAVCCSRMCCSVLQCVAVCRPHLTRMQLPRSRAPLPTVPAAVHCQCVAVCCSVLQCIAVCCSVLHCVAPIWYGCNCLGREQAPLRGRLQIGFCPLPLNHCTKPHHFPRSRNKSPTKWCGCLFFLFLSTKKWKKAFHRHWLGRSTSSLGRSHEFPDPKDSNVSIGKLFKFYTKYINFGWVTVWSTNFGKAARRYRSLLQNIVSFIGLFCKRDLSFWGAYYSKRKGGGCTWEKRGNVHCVTVCCSVLQCAAVCCSVLQCVAVCCSVLQCVAVCCGMLQCVAVIFIQSCKDPWDALSS